MSRYRFELATPADDADLRQIMAATPMHGSMVVSFRREPSYFDAAVVEGQFRQVVAARDLETGRVVGFGARSISTRFVNGEPMPIGYLSSLRLLAEHRKISLVARGYRYFRELHQDSRTKLYLTTIAVENHAVMDLLTSGRAGLPTYRPAGNYFTFALPTASIRNSSLSRDCFEIREATAEDLPAIADFMQAQSRHRQFFPQYDMKDFGDARKLLRGLRLCDLRLATAGNEILGMAGFWNQQPFRQTVIDEYRGTLRMGRPLLNWTAKFFKQPQLPPRGGQLRSIFTALPLVAENDPEVFAGLINRLLADVPRAEADYLLLGMHESDPYLSVARSFSGRCYTTRLFLVTWDDGRDLATSLDGRPIYLELGAL